jgi:hypothetical protein
LGWALVLSGPDVEIEGDWSASGQYERENVQKKAPGLKCQGQSERIF